MDSAQGELARRRTWAPRNEPRTRERGESFSKQKKLTDEWEALNERPDEVLKEQDRVASQIEALKGCGTKCQAERDRALNLNTKCFTTLGCEGYAVGEVTKECDRRFPIPRENILRDVVPE